MNLELKLPSLIDKVVMAFFFFLECQLECNDDLSADRSFSGPAAEFRSHGRPVVQHSYAEKLKAVRRHYSERCKSFEISSLQPLAADTAAFPFERD